MDASTAPAGMRHGFARCGLALFALVLGTNLPSPLYAVYAQRFGFSALVLTLIFATYAGTLMATLLVAGSAADHCGYRQVLLPGLGLAVVAALGFAWADRTGWLFAARALQGVAVGMSSGALTAALIRTEPSANRRRASLVASLATAGGGGLGPLIAGACATWLPAPTRTCYLFEVAALVLAAGTLVALPGSLGRTRRALRLSLPQLPGKARASFAGACAVSFLAWAVTAVFLAVVPSYVSSLTGDHSLVLAGVSSGLILLLSAITQLSAFNVEAERLQEVGLMILAGGLIVLLVAGASRLLVAVISSALVAGVGQGLAFMGAIRRANELAPTDAHAAAISAFYVATYLGVGIPVIGVGLLATIMTTTAAVNIFSMTALVSIAVIAAIIHRRSDEIGRPIRSEFDPRPDTH